MRLARQPMKDLVHGRCAPSDRRRVIDRRSADLFEPEIGARVEMDDLHALLKQIDEGQEQRAVQAALVEPRGLHVGRRDHDDAAREQRLEQPAEDHRVGDVGDAEFIEAQEPRFARERIRHGLDGIVALDLACLARPAARRGCARARRA